MAAKKSLVIVESPAKANTINKYLGKDFVVKASLGHVKDLPKSKLGVDVDNDFEPVYESIPGKEKVSRNCGRRPKPPAASSWRPTRIAKAKPSASI